MAKLNNQERATEAFRALRKIFKAIKRTEYTEEMKDNGQIIVEYLQDQSGMSMDQIDREEVLPISPAGRR
jgi:hypothetical protein